jgi:hypothetical protein
MATVFLRPRDLANCDLPYYPNHSALTAAAQSLLAQAISEAQHEVAFQVVDPRVFNVVGIAGSGDANILVEYIEDPQFDLTTVVFQEQFAEGSVPQGTICIETICSSGVDRIVKICREIESFWELNY